MKALQLTGRCRLEWTEVPKPRLEEDSDVLIQMRSVGVCGSDMHYFRSGKIGSQVVRYPFLLGHEGAGAVVETGSRVTRVQPGDLVAIDPAMPCFECDQCRSGRTHTCRNLKFLGTPGQAEGCLAEYLVMPETSLYPLADPLSSDDGVLAEPLSIAYYAVQPRTQETHDAAGILGFGPIGMSVFLCAREMGTRHLVVTDKIEDRLQHARGAGASWCGNPLSEDVVEGILHEHSLGLDVVYECCGQQDAMDQAIHLLKPGGTLVVLGIPEISRWSFSVDELRHKEITMVNVRRQNECVQPVLDWMASGTLRHRDMITHRFPADSATEAFSLVSGYHDGVMKAIIEF